ncbi:MAG TPA: hypothetical protein VK923_11185 [Euzebyales bacterium]|nr:hypothetical protein [Euzebyales bacterium]
MIHWVLVLVLFAHGWVHLVVWGMVPAIPSQVADPTHSWVLGDRRPVARVLTGLTMTLFAVAALALALQAAWWGPVTVAAAGVSLLLVALFPAAIANVWIVAPVAIDLALIIGVVWLDRPVRAMFGG